MRVLFIEGRGKPCCHERDPRAHPVRNIAGWASLRLPKQRRHGLKCHATPARASAGILANRNTPFSPHEISALQTGV